MSFTNVVYLYCDGEFGECELNGGEAYSADGGYETIKVYKQDAKADGWIFRGNKAYCPSCAKHKPGSVK